MCEYRPYDQGIHVATFPHEVAALRGAVRRLVALERGGWAAVFEQLSLLAAEDAAAVDVGVKAGYVVAGETQVAALYDLSYLLRICAPQAAQAGRVDHDSLAAAAKENRG